MGGPYNIPRNYKGESKILYIFSIKAFAYTAVGMGIGILLYYILKMFKLSKIGIACIIIFGVIGFALGTFKMPDSPNFTITRKTGGESIDQIILRWLKFKNKKGKIYIYKKKEEVHKDVK